MDADWPVDADGVVAPGYEPVRRAFERTFDGQPGMGAAVAVLVDGQPVVDLWGGAAGPSRRWQQDTATVIFSCTKGLLAILAGRHIAGGSLRVDTPVAALWPEFAAEGKQDVLVSDLLSHRAGLAAPSKDWTVDDVLDWSIAAGLLATQRPLWEPGTGHAYHALTFGWLVGEVLARVGERSVGAQLASEVAGPLGADAWIGLPDRERPRVATLTLTSALVKRSATVDYWTGRASTLGGAFPAALADSGSGFSDPRILAAEVPGAGGVATARSLAAIWSATIVETGGIRLLDDAVTAGMTPVRSAGRPVFDAPAPWPAWGLGFQRPSASRRFLSPASFGHAGAGGQLAFADPNARVGFAYLTNRLDLTPPDDRAASVVDALREVLRSR